MVITGIGVVMNIYVFGWYGHKNLGDEAFITAIRGLWPEHCFHFSDSFDTLLKTPSCIKYDAVFIGGGSFLDQQIKNINKVTQEWPVFFVGVGINRALTPDNRKALQTAKGVYVRDQKSKNIFPDSIVVGDLVLSMGKHQNNKLKQVLVLPNSYLSPSYNSQAWVDSSEAWYAHELAKILDSFVEKKIKVVFYPMCTNKSLDDRIHAASILSRMRYRGNGLIEWVLSSNQRDFLSVLSCSELCITNRLHGGIFSTITRTPFIMVSSNDKMLSYCEEIGIPWLEYYGFSANGFYSTLQEIKNPEWLQKVEKYHQQVREDWRCAASDITTALSRLCKMGTQ